MCFLKGFRKVLEEKTFCMYQVSLNEYLSKLENDFKLILLGDFSFKGIFDTVLCIDFLDFVDGRLGGLVKLIDCNIFI